MSEVQPWPSPTNKSWLGLTMEGVTVREVLNEVAVLSGGTCWIYEVDPVTTNPTWRLF